jgi:hypothetical protein
VSTLSVARVLAIHRSDYESIADRFQDSARAVLENLLRYTQQVGGSPTALWRLALKQLPSR